MTLEWNGGAIRTIYLLNSIHRDINQLGIQRNNLEQKSQTITYNHDKLVNIAKQVKNNISLRRMEFSIIKRVKELKLTSWGTWGGRKKHQEGVNKKHQTIFKTTMTFTITFSNIQLVRNKENELLEYLTDRPLCLYTYWDMAERHHWE